LAANAHDFLGQSLGNLSLALIGMALIAVILAIWRWTRRARRQCENTVICDRCNVVTLADGHVACRCGGQYLSLLEMEWISQNAPRRSIQGKIIGTKPTETECASRFHFLETF